MPKSISLHDVLEPLKQALLASRDVMISSQICGSNLQKVFTLGDGCWLPTLGAFLGFISGCFQGLVFEASAAVWGLGLRPLGSVPTTPDPNTSAKVSQYKWEPYRDTNWWCIYYFLPRGGHTLAKVSR